MLAYYILCVAFILYRLSKAIYNLYFHPLAKFPGPKLAAVSHVYEFYWSIVRDGEFIWEIERMHKKYGPIVRITPRELHIADPTFYNEIYAGNPHRIEGDYRFTRSTGVTKSMFAAVDHDLHQARRSNLTKFFSKRSISDIQPIIQDKVERFIKRLEDSSKDGSPANLSTLSAAFTADTISHYSYGVSLGCLDGESENILTDATQAVLALSHWLRFMPIRFTNAKKIHPRLIENFFPKAAVVLNTHRTISRLALDVLNAKEPKAPHENMFAALADPKLPAEERTLGHLEDEGFVVLAAGTETTAYSLSVTLFYLLDNPTIFSKLYDEIKAVMPDPSECPPLSVLENLPLLRAVINEGLRLSMGTLTRHPRISPDRVLQYKDWTIPAGTPCSTVTYFVHTDPEKFPNPWTFDPYRWIRAAEQGQHLESNLALFLKGTRSCLGINLANAEMFMLVANLVRRVDMKLYESTTIDCVLPGKDHSVVIPKDTSGVRATIFGLKTS
ncbi:cytochrome P450 [Hypoxylon trugodes]|uniref:cytochrome P450 n=1 Tax=Hypoxylon trugodes TaxID=326681 RepID=UPI00219AE19A|nr:cytochrome P450 [Hypoxylon trugodes]KAI1393512.1 cytochrome P450 [Hypoxylon trugodes]